MEDNLIFLSKDIKKNSEIEILQSLYMPISSYYSIIDNLFHISLNGKIINNGSFFIFESYANAEYSIECASCLQKLERKVEFFIKEIFSNKNIDKEEDICYIKNGEIDLKDAIIPSMIQNLPSRSICYQDCKGLCSICGINLNIEKCDCNQEFINEDFIKLRDYFN